MLPYLAITVGRTGTTVDKFLPEPKGTTTLHSLVSRDNPNQFQQFFTTYKGFGKY